MALSFHTQDMREGIQFISISDSRFKTNFLSVHFITPLMKETSACNAVIPIMLSKSSEEYPGITEINHKLSSLYGAGLHGDLFRFGDSQVITLAASCITDSYTLEQEKITSQLAELMIGCLFHPYTNSDQTAFQEKTFQLCRQELLDAIDGEINEKRSYAVSRAKKIIYQGEPASVPVLGERAAAESLTAEEAFRQYQKLLKTSEIKIFFVGGGEPDEVREKFAQAFSSEDFQRKFEGRQTSLKSAAKAKPETVTEILDVAQSKMVMAYKFTDDKEPAVKIMNALYGGTTFSKLFVNVREKLSLCYYCSASLDMLKGAMVVDSGVEKENIEKAQSEIDRQMGEMASGNFTDEELAEAILSKVNNLRSVNDSPYSLAKWYLQKLYEGDCCSPEEEISRLQAVQRNDVVEAAQSMKLDSVYVLTGKEGK